jgi:hypothetical protein
MEENMRGVKRGEMGVGVNMTAARRMVCNAFLIRIPHHPDLILR